MIVLRWSNKSAHWSCEVKQVQCADLLDHLTLPWNFYGTIYRDGFESDRNKYGSKSSRN